jgi:D-glycero-beta-D-manno-heptose 1-phosphate adenylyltransferase
MRNLLNNIENKMYSIEEFLELRKSLRHANQKVVFTNGCFDILHLGHVVYLAQAAELGSFLVVAVNDDASVRAQNKAPNRPINPENARAFLLASLSFVDAVVLFSEDTPLNLIQQIEPDVLVKGADYDANETNPESKKFIVGSTEVKAYGGEVRTIDLVDGYSTTSILAKK